MILAVKSHESKKIQIAYNMEKKELSITMILLKSMKITDCIQYGKHGVNNYNHFTEVYEDYRLHTIWK